ncbi:hypothetical protein HY419_01625, partial [candidate division WWE3 bacterium]|nr:hypothetical protein [candidate division WWE3 bacterium]
MKSLQKSSENAIKNCIELAKSDRIVIVTDRKTRKIGDSLKAEAAKITPNVLFLFIEDYGKRPLQELPAKMVSAITIFKPNVSIYAASGQTGELQNFRSKLIDLLAYKLDCAHAHMIGITEEIMLD